jgi:hypothetical protein
VPRGALKPTVLFEVEIDDFEDVLLQLKVYWWW